MFKVKAITPDPKKPERQLRASLKKQAKAGFERQTNEDLSEVGSPTHGQRPYVKLIGEPDLSRPTSQLTYQVTNPCYQDLEQRVRARLGEAMQVEIES